ncbi:MAG: AAA family ATPase [Planctomycetota bacterium]
MNTPFNESDRPAAAGSNQPMLGGRDGDTEQYTDAFNLLSLTMAALRGRMLFAVLAAVLLAVPAAYVGYTLTDRTYQSTSTISVRANADTLLYTDVGAGGERLENFLETQAKIAESQRVLELAVDHPALVEFGWPEGIAGQRALRNGLRVQFRRRDSTFNLILINGDPAAAEAAARAVTASYMSLVAEYNSTEIDERRLDDALRQRDAEIANIRANIQALTASFGNTDLSARIDSEEKRNFQIKSDIDAIEAQITLREQLGGDDEESDPAKLSVEQLAYRDAQLDGLLSRRAAVRTERQEQSRTLMSRHPTIRALDRELASLETLIADRAVVVRDRISNLNPAENPEALTIEQLRTQLALRKQDAATSDRRLRDLNQAWGEVQTEQQELDRLIAQRDEIARRKDKLELERDSLREGRIRVLTEATPATLNDDKRRMFAAAGGLGGGAAGIGLVAAFGIYRRSFRYVEDLDDPARFPPLLGTLPELDRKDPETERIAAISVHNLRNMLHTISQFNDDTCQVIVCTSAESGDGKTTLIQSLGASYALTGLRTIVVDLDLVGAGLTARLGMTGRRGTADLLGGLEPTKCIKRTATDKLYALPAGDASACRPEQLAHRPVQQVIDWLRERFDVVLIDTGPVLGSLEAGLCTNLADHVLLVVPRRQPNRIARAAIDRLERLGARRVGLVFNRASTVDLRQSLSAASVGAPSQPRMTQRPHERRLDEDFSIAGSIPPRGEDFPPASPPAAEGGTGR